MEKKDVYDMFMESERNINLMHIEQDNIERTQSGDRNYLDIALGACKKFNLKFDGTFDKLQTDEAEENLTIEEIKLKYDLQDDDVVLRLWTLKSTIKTERQTTMNYNELLAFLKSAMNYDEMQIWLMRKQMEGVELTLNDALKKFFELKSNDDILRLYDVEQNYNQNNIKKIRK